MRGAKWLISGVDGMGNEKNTTGGLRVLEIFWNFLGVGFFFDLALYIYVGHK